MACERLLAPHPRTQALPNSPSLIINLRIGRTDTWTRKLLDWSVMYSTVTSLATFEAN